MPLAPTTPSPGAIRLDSRRGSTVDRITFREPGSQQRLEPPVRVERARLLDDRQAAVRALNAFSESAHSASRQSTALCPPNPNAFEMPIARLSPLASGRASCGT